MKKFGMLLFSVFIPTGILLYTLIHYRPTLTYTLVLDFHKDAGATWFFKIVFMIVLYKYRNVFTQKSKAILLDDMTVEQKRASLLPWYYSVLKTGSFYGILYLVGMFDNVSMYWITILASSVLYGLYLDYSQRQDYKLKNKKEEI